MISHVELYTKPDCPYCTRAKQLLKTFNIPFNEQLLGREFTREILLEKFPYAKSYPLVVIDGFHIGGYSQLEEKINEEYKSDKQLLNEGE